MKITNQQVIQLVQAKKSLKASGERFNFKFGLALNQNYKLVESNFNTLVEVDPHNLYKKERQEIAELQADFTKDFNNPSTIKEKKAVINKKIEELNKLLEPEFERWEGILKGTLEVKLKKVKADLFPEKLTDAEMEILMIMLEE